MCGRSLQRTMASSPAVLWPCVHARNEHHYDPMAEFGARMQALYGSEFGRLDMREWIARAADGGMDPLISSYLESLVEKGRVIEFPYLGAEVGEF